MGFISFTLHRTVSVSMRPLEQRGPVRSFRADRDVCVETEQVTCQVGRLRPRTGRDWPFRDPAGRTDSARPERTGDRTPPSCSSTWTVWPIVSLLSSAARFPVNRENHCLRGFRFNWMHLNAFFSCSRECRRPFYTDWYLWPHLEMWTLKSKWNFFNEMFGHIKTAQMYS